MRVNNILFKLIYSLLMMNILYFSLFSNELKQKIKIGCYNNPPKIYKDNNGNFTGYHIDIIKEIAKNENWDLEFVEGSWEEGLLRLKNGEIDIMLDVAYSIDREKGFDFNKESVLLNWGVLYIRKEDNIDSIIDLENKKIATMKDSIHTIGEKGIINILNSFNIKADFVFTSNYDQCFELLSQNKVDAAVVNRLFGLEKEREYKLKNTNIIFNPVHIKYGFKKNSEKSKYLIERIDNNLLKFKINKNSVLNRAFSKYLIGVLKKEKDHLKNYFNIKTVFLLSFMLVFLCCILFFIFFSNKNKRYNYAKYLKSNPSMNIIRNSIIDSSLYVFAIFSIPLTLLFIYQGISISWNNLLYLNIITTVLVIILLLFINVININFKVIILILTFFLNGIVILKIWGRIGIGVTFFLTPAIIISIIYSKKSGFLILFLGSIITLVLGILISNNIIKLDYDFINYSKTLFSWLFSLIIIFVIFLTLIFGIEKFYLILIESVENLEDTVKKRTADLEKEIQERIKTERKLLDAKIKAEEANLAKTNFLSNITHEIRTPLNAILGYAQILKSEKNIKEENKRQLDTIIESGEHLLELINEVLEMSKIESGIKNLNLDNFDLYDMLNEIYKIFKMKMENKGLDFKIEIDKDVPKIIFSDSIKIKQVLINLIGNAFKFTKYGYVNVKVFKNQDKICINFSDSGIGIEKNDIEKIFNLFEQSDTTKFIGGTGLGLTISKEFAKLLGGDIRVESKIGKGTIFTFEFQYQIGVESLIKRDEEVIEIVGIKSDKKIKALIVDDRESTRDILTKMLSPIGFDTMEAKDGFTALKLVDSYKPDIILLDLVMPEISGEEVIRKIRSSNNNIKIIAVTASVMIENRENILKNGADSFILKPFKKQEILMEIKRLLNIEYIYEEEREKKPKKVNNKELIEKWINELPENIIKEFRKSLIVGDIKEIKRYNSIIKEYNTELSEYFNIFIEEFDFNIILSLISRGNYE